MKPPPQWCQHTSCGQGASTTPGSGGVEENVGLAGVVTPAGRTLEIDLVVTHGPTRRGSPQTSVGDEPVGDAPVDGVILAVAALIPASVTLASARVDPAPARGLAGNQRGSQDDQRERTADRPLGGEGPQQSVHVFVPFVGFDQLIGVG